MERKGEKGRGIKLKMCMGGIKVCEQKERWSALPLQPIQPHSISLHVYKLRCKIIIYLTRTHTTQLARRTNSIWQVRQVESTAITVALEKNKINTRRTNVKLAILVRKKSYVKLRKSLKSTHLIVRLNAVSEEKSTELLGKQFQILTTRSVKKEDLAVQTHWRLHSLYSPQLLWWTSAQKNRQSAYPHDQR